MAYHRGWNNRLKNDRETRWTYSEQFTVRLTAGQRRRLGAMAVRVNMPASEIVRRLVVECLDQSESSGNVNASAIDKPT